MADADLVAVEATEERYRGLLHMPGRLPLDEDGTGLWPADQFTFALIREGAIRRVEAPSAPPKPSEPEPSDPSKSVAPKKGA